MTNIIYRLHERERYNDALDEDRLEKSRVARLSNETTIEVSPNIPIVYGFAAIPVIPVYAEVITAVTKPVIYYKQTAPSRSGYSRDAYIGYNNQNQNVLGKLLSKSVSGANEMLMMQGVMSTTVIEKVLAIFVNKESYGFDGWASSTDDDNPYLNSTHHINVGGAYMISNTTGPATTLADYYSDTGRDLSAKFSKVTALTGLYYGADTFNKRLPTIHLFVEATRFPGRQVPTNVFDIANYNSENYRHGLYGALHAYLIGLINNRSILGRPKILFSNLNRLSWRILEIDSILSTELPGEGLKVRMRHLHYEADAGNKQTETLYSCPIPLNAHWPCWGILDSGKSIGDSLKTFKESCPPLSLFISYDGDLKSKVVSLFRRADFEVVMVIDDTMIIEVSTSNDARKTAILFNNYELDFAQDGIGADESTETINVALCGNVPHARNIKAELDTRSRLTTVNMTLSRRALALEPGDVVSIESANVNGLVVIDDVGLDEKIQVLITGKLLTVLGSTVSQFKFPGIYKQFMGIKASDEVSLTIPKIIDSDNLHVTYTTSPLPYNMIFDPVTRKLIKRND